MRKGFIVDRCASLPGSGGALSPDREKLIAPGTRVIVYVGPLTPGRYEYFGDFFPVTARGWLVVRQ